MAGRDARVRPPALWLLTSAPMAEPGPGGRWSAAKVVEQGWHAGGENYPGLSGAIRRGIVTRHQPWELMPGEDTCRC